MVEDIPGQPRRGPPPNIDGLSWDFIERSHPSSPAYPCFGSIPVALDRVEQSQTDPGHVDPVLVLIIFIFPFSVYNYARFHRFVLLNTNAGYAMYWANHPFYGTRFVPILSYEEYYNLIPPELVSLDEAAMDQALLRLGLHFIVDDPKRYLLLSLSRIPIYFEFWPSSGDGIFVTSHEPPDLDCICLSCSMAWFVL
jgi:hypothetical protein